MVDVGGAPGWHELCQGEWRTTLLLTYVLETPTRLERPALFRRTAVYCYEAVITLRLYVLYGISIHYSRGSRAVRCDCLYSVLYRVCTALRV